jgi:ketosteroid isomerase-like protein
MKTKTIFGLFSFVALALCLYLAPSSSAASPEDDVRQVAIDFTKAMNNLDYKLMSSIFWHSPKTTSFEPSTGYPFLYQGWDAIGEWWKDLETTQVQTNFQTLHHLQVTMLTDDVGITTTYCINTNTDPKTKNQTVDLIRQTLVVQKIGGKWLIVHHHASGFPVK